MTSTFEAKFQHKGNTREKLIEQIEAKEKEAKEALGSEVKRRSKFVDGGDNIIYIWTRP